MRSIIFPLLAATLFAVLPAHAAETPTPAQVQAAMRSWAEQLSAKDPEAAKDRQVQEARTTMKVKAVENCEVERKTSYVKCDIVLAIPGKQDVNTALKFALAGDKWTFVSR